MSNEQIQPAMPQTPEEVRELLTNDLQKVTEGVLKDKEGKYYCEECLEMAEIRHVMTSPDDYDSELWCRNHGQLV